MSIQNEYSQFRLTFPLDNIPTAPTKIGPTIFRVPSKSYKGFH